jgi:hypothetical protein
MCSVSFLPTGDGYALAMNRDEQLSRMAALPPAMWKCGSLRALYPHELSGGSWIGVNEAAVGFALINWYSKPSRKGANTLSRGVVIPTVLAARTVQEARTRVAELDLARMNPFRLIMVAGPEKQIVEWRAAEGSWDERRFPWKRQHWFSSGFDEAGANRWRRMACLHEEERSSPDSVEWLRRLHRSHHPTRGGYSICMHRIDACTVSYTELSVNAATASMLYQAGPACQRGPRFARTLRLSGRKFSPAA